MQHKSFLLGLLIAVSTLFTGCATTPPPKEKVVFQVSNNDAGKWNLALNNAKNVQDSYGADKVEVEIVVYGPGIGMLKAESPTANRVTAATLAGIQIVACENTMAAQKLTKADMNPAVGYVPAGVVELMARQKQGWAYIRP
ncbi:MAG: DsrE family protein [Gammaproteobacteria bacterium]|nr:DsrE family protein [Gammaproteobacteria bacterium]MBU0787051.1 DsrE family protein [Gammaproteobacteria bacterium]MBU0816302.1 DsrE family protein [Gammaproteobacteria bacterium]MBU1787939.1 DsrE family protein [Gammaproteobacteria bacterium]